MGAPGGVAALVGSLPKIQNEMVQQDDWVLGVLALPAAWIARCGPIVVPCGQSRWPWFSNQRKWLVKGRMMSVSGWRARIIYDFRLGET